MLAFEVIAGPDAGKAYPVPNDRVSVDIGRSSTCDVLLVSPTVAKHHLRFATRGGRYLHCLEVREGHVTQLNGRDAIPPFGIVPGDEIRVGEFILRLRGDDQH